MSTLLAEGPVAEALQNTSVRDVPAAKTLATIKPLLADFGIHRIIDVSLEGVPACPVFQVVRDDARSEYFNAGKGYTATESLVSGLMEAIEVHCYERADPGLLIARQALSPAEAACIVPPALLEAGPAGRAAPVASPATLVRGVSLVTGQAAYLPADRVYRDLGGGVVTAASPNGVASGNSAAEAQAHALCEMLERHALADFHRGAAPDPEWVSAPAESARVQACLSELREKGMTASFLLISKMAGVAVFICFLSLRDPRGIGLAVQGYGAHVDPTIAMARALAEAVQILALCPVRDELGETGGAGDDHVVMTTKQSALLDPVAIARQRRSDFGLMKRLKSLGIASDPAYVFDPVGAERRDSSESILDAVVSGLREEGIEHLYSCVISPASLPVVVVKCFCPGLGCIEGL